MRLTQPALGVRAGPMAPSINRTENQRFHQRRKS
jgi:hypothetical protein